jgi:potassium uptake TrkH family protein
MPRSIRRLFHAGGEEEQGVPATDWRRRLTTAANTGVLLLGLLAIVSLVAEHGFYLSAEMERLAREGNLVVLYGFAFLAFLKLLLAENRRAHFRARWVELSLLVIIVAYLLFPGQVEDLLLSFNPYLTPDALTRLYLIITQFFVIAAFVPSVLRYSKRLMASNIQPSLLIVLSFLVLISVGTMLLLLPRATVSHSFTFIDALFTATSAVCVTGLIVVDTATYFTPFGHIVLMVLIQIGGLGIMTLTTFFAFIMGGGARLKEYSTMQSLLGEEGLGRIKQTIIRIALVTFALEAVGAVALYYSLVDIELGQGVDRTFFSIFHSISAFCNAGFTLTTQNLAEPSLRQAVGMQATIMGLIVLGGIGYPVLTNVGAAIWRRNGLRTRLSLHTKLVLITTAILLVGGTAGLYWLEQDRLLHGLDWEKRILVSLFHSVSARTAGFNTVDIGALSAPALFFVILLMWIGASPGSTGGGIKTTTAALSFLNILAIASGRNKVEIFRKRVSDIAITKAFSTVLLSFVFVNTAVFFLLLTERAPFEAILFEVVSAASTVGLSTGLTPHLSDMGKVIIILCMFVGRVGYLATVIALTRHRFEGRYDYTEENVLVT